MPQKNFDWDDIKTTLRGWLTNNKTYKLVALFIALVMWVSVTIESKTKLDLDVQLEITTPAESSLVTVGETPSTVHIVLWGPDDEIRKVTASQIKFNLDIKNPVKGEKIYPLSAANKFIPDKLVLLSIDPREIKLNFQSIK
jgi:hypothetical protein